MNQAHNKLGLVDVGVTETGTNHGASSGEDNIQAKTDVGPDVTQDGHVLAKFPNAQVYS